MASDGRQDQELVQGYRAYQDEHDPEERLPAAHSVPLNRQPRRGSRPEGESLTQSAVSSSGLITDRPRHHYRSELGKSNGTLGEQSCVCAGMKTRALLALVVSAALTGAVAGFLLLGPEAEPLLSRRTRSSRR